MLAFFVGYLMAFYHRDKVPLRIATQGRFTKVWVGRDKVVSTDVQVGEVAATTAGHENLLAHLVGFFQNQYTTTTLSGGECAEQACGTATQHDDVIVYSR